jgi:molybdopterin/thiamine biosynthesis adenylyltransferase
VYNRIYLIGLGGIGSNLIRPLSQLLSYTHSPSGFELTLIDGDKVEAKNLERQFFEEGDIGRNKAEVFAQKARLPGVYIDCMTHYVSKDNVGATIKDGCIVILAVDNNQTRNIVQEHCISLRDVVLINGGNEDWDGDVTIYHKFGGEEILPPIWEGQPGIRNPSDLHPSEHCTQKYVSAPQLLCTNFAVASNILAILTPILKKNVILWRQLFFDIRWGKSSASTLLAPSEISHFSLEG